VSIGIVQAGEAYAFDMGGGFVPYRRNVRWTPSQDAPIEPLLDHFDFVQDRARWGCRFRFGLFDIGDSDMLRISKAMKADPVELLF
jgi:hypothetical protein